MCPGAWYIAAQACLRCQNPEPWEANMQPRRAQHAQGRGGSKAVDVCDVNFVITDYGQHAAFNRGDQTSVQEPLPAWSCTTMSILSESGGIQPGRRRAGIGGGPWASPGAPQHGSNRAGCDDSQRHGATRSICQGHGAGWDIPPEVGHRWVQHLRTRQIKDTGKCICHACKVHRCCCMAPLQVQHLILWCSVRRLCAQARSTVTIRIALRCRLRGGRTRCLACCAVRVLILHAGAGRMWGSWAHLQLCTRGKQVANIQSGNYCQPRCAEPWTEVIFTDPAEGKVQVRPLLSAQLSLAMATATA
jgi:hypothetical protein